MKSKFVLAVSLLLLACSPGFARRMSDTEIIDAIRENPWRAACGHCPYVVPEFRDTPAPKGYKAFYVSHVGRHGSRYQGDTKMFLKPVATLSALDSAKLLTPEGIKVCEAVKRIYQANLGNEGMLSARGGLEHRGISERLYGRVPEVFMQKSRPEVNCTSTKVPRCIQSMANFGTALQSKAASVEIKYNVQLKDIPMFAPPSGTPTRHDVDEYLKPYEAAKEDFPGGDVISGRWFNDKQAAAAVVGHYRTFLYDTVWILASAGCLDPGYTLTDFFTPEELFEFYKIRNLYFCGNYGYLNDELSLKKMHAADKVSRLIIKEADDAVAGNGRCADLRFAHDGQTGPIQVLLDMEYVISDGEPGESYSFWPSWKYVCMGQNIQMIFYRNKSGDVLVKLLANEIETRINGLEAVNGVYYRWDELRTHILRRIGEYTELPDYWKSHIGEKAAQIRRLQKDEAFGFYFFSDSHFPENTGHTAPAICALEGSTAARKVFFGGDMSANRDDFIQGMYPQACALQQIRGNAGLYVLRGNHDCMTRTKPVNAPKKALPQWKTAGFIKSYTCPDAIFDTSHTDSDYFFVDEPATKTRFIAFDTTDSVRGDNVVYGITDSQLIWIIENAVLGAPKGWHLVFMGHVPFAKEHAKGTRGVVEAGECMSALACHRTFTFKGKEYDFSTRKDLVPLMAVSGHRHFDTVSTTLGIPQFIVTCDGIKGSKVPGRKEGTISEQAFDYISVSKDLKRITLVRIGSGEDREFSFEDIK